LLNKHVHLKFTSIETLVKNLVYSFKKYAILQEAL